jgi:hypothetical protein
LFAWVAAAREAAAVVPGVEAAGVPAEPPLVVSAPVDPAEVVVVAALASGSWRLRPGRVGGSVAVDTPVLLADVAAVVVACVGAFAALVVSTLPPGWNEPLVLLATAVPAVAAAGAGSLRRRGIGGSAGLGAPAGLPAAAATFDPPVLEPPLDPPTAPPRPGWPTHGSGRRCGAVTWGSVDAEGIGLPVVTSGPVGAFTVVVTGPVGGFAVVTSGPVGMFAVVPTGPAGRVIPVPADGDSKCRPVAGDCCSARADPDQPPVDVAWPPPQPPPVDVARPPPDEVPPEVPW